MAGFADCPYVNRVGIGAKEFHLLRISQAGGENAGTCLDGEILGVRCRWNFLFGHQWLADVFIDAKVNAIQEC